MAQDRLARLEFLTLILVGCALVVEYGLPPALKQLSPGLSVSVASHTSTGPRPTDPWGKRWGPTAQHAATAPPRYSLGPNGRDEGGAGDDLVPDGASTLAAAIAFLIAYGFGLSLVPFWVCCAVRHYRAPPEEHLRDELRHAAVLAFLPSAVLVFLALFTSLGQPFDWEQAGQQLLIPAWAGAAGSICLACFLVCLGLRLARGRGQVTAV